MITYKIYKKEKSMPIKLRYLIGLNEFDMAVLRIVVMSEKKSSRLIRFLYFVIGIYLNVDFLRPIRELI